MEVICHCRFFKKSDFDLRFNSKRNLLTLYFHDDHVTLLDVHFLVLISFRRSADQLKHA